MLRNAVKPLFTEEYLTDAIFNKRAEALSIEQFAELTHKMQGSYTQPQPPHPPKGESYCSEDSLTLVPTPKEREDEKTDANIED